ncbi:BrnA antitoxin family protein [Acidisphaera sp. S103]|uniref:BrnA antitoxin family protein n=1 Tax=Acidisphaera sp. S103 TaxID=1747223 RepID=UPI00131B0070|nr:BrnA antitoxin family protein [Acidisphaera sp. S103]
MRKGNSDPLPPNLAAELAALEAMPEDAIDTSEMPEVKDWSEAQRGRFYKPKKVQKTLRIDADVLAWFEAQGPGHLTRMNRALRATMLLEMRRKKKREAA